MSSALAEPLAITQPRIIHVPEYVSTTAGDDAIELALLAGLELDPWQQMVLRHSLGTRADGQWAAFEIGLCVSRQNGKGGILEARELAGLFLIADERLIIHSAHQFDTSLEHFHRLKYLIENTPDLIAEVKRISNSHGEEGIELKNGSRIRFRTRTPGGGRGFSGDLLVLDEAMDIPEPMHGALLPTLSARPNPQVWYTGSAVDQQNHRNGVVFSRVRERGIEAQDTRLCYFEWSLPYATPDDVPASGLRDPDAWAQSNPALDIRIDREYVDAESRALGYREFCVERLGVGDWPAGDGEASVLDLEKWDALADQGSKLLAPLVIAYDVSPDRRRASISACGKRADEHDHVEVIEHKSGTGWVVDRLVELKANHAPLAIVCDGASPAASFIHELAERGVTVRVADTKEYAAACGQFYDGCDQGTLRHLGDEALRSAVKGAAVRPIGEAWGWTRRSSSVDITPLVSSTLARWGLADTRKQPYQAFGLN